MSTSGDDWMWKLPDGYGDAPGQDDASASYAARDGADPAIVAARVAGNVGDVLGGIHQESYNAGRLVGRVEVLNWAQSTLQVELMAIQKADRFADTRGLEAFLSRVQDSLKGVQDGTGEWAGLVPPVVGQ